jgi:hypothetical protein
MLAGAHGIQVRYFAVQRYHYPCGIAEESIECIVVVVLKKNDIPLWKSACIAHPYTHTFSIQGLFWEFTTTITQTVNTFRLIQWFQLHDVGTILAQPCIICMARTYTHAKIWVKKTFSYTFYLDIA